MISNESEYVYVHARSFAPDGDILPARGHAERLVRAVDLAFLREAVLERSAAPRHESFYPFPRSTISSYNQNPYNDTVHADGLAWWSGMASDIRGLFASGRFIDPGQALTGGAGPFAPGAFAPATPSIPNSVGASAASFRRVDTVRRMFYDISRLTRCRLQTSISYGSGGWAASAFSYYGGAPVATDASIPTVEITGGVGQEVLDSPLFSVDGATAIVTMGMSSAESAGHNWQKWIAVPLSGMTVPLDGWRGSDLQAWAVELGWTTGSGYQWNGTAYIDRIYFDVTYPAEINSLNWIWQPS